MSLKNILLSLLIASGFTTHTRADFDFEACAITSIAPLSSSGASTLRQVLNAAIPLLAIEYAMMNSGQTRNDVIDSWRWGTGSNNDNTTKCDSKVLASYCTEQRAGITLYRSFNRNAGGFLNTGIASGDWDQRGSGFTCPDAHTNNDPGEDFSPGVVPIVAFNQAMISAEQSLGSAGQHLSENSQFDPNGIVEAAAVEGVAAKDGGDNKKAGGPVATGKSSLTKRASGGSGAGGPLSSVEGLKSASLSPEKSIDGAKVDTSGTDENGNYKQNGSTNGAKGAEGTGWSLGATAGAQGGSDSMNFGRDLASVVNPMGSEDPENYFALIGLDENIFKKIEKRYRETTHQWARVDLTKDSASRRDRALAAAKDPELSKPKKDAQIH